MDRDYDIGRLTYEEFYGDTLSQDSIIKTLAAFNITLYDSNGNFRETSELINELFQIRRATTSFRNIRRLGDVIMALINAEEVKNNLSLDESESSIELDSFLGTFKIVQGGVSL